MRIISVILAMALVATTTQSAPVKPGTFYSGPVLDMHIHAYGAGGEGPPSYICTPFVAFKPLDPGKGGPGRRCRCAGKAAVDR